MLVCYFCMNDMENGTVGYAYYYCTSMGGIDAGGGTTVILLWLNMFLLYIRPPENCVGIYERARVNEARAGAARAHFFSIRSIFVTRNIFTARTNKRPQHTYHTCMYVLYMHGATDISYQTHLHTYYIPYLFSKSRN